MRKTVVLPLLVLLITPWIAEAVEESGNTGQQHVFVSPQPAGASGVSSTTAASGPCSLMPASPTFLTEGPTDTRLHAPSTGTLRAVMLFVDFPDAVANEETAILYDRAVTFTRAYFDETSGEAFSLDVTPIHRWFRMPLPSATYGFKNLTFALMRAYLREVVTQADADVDFSGYDAIFVVSSSRAQIPFSPTFLAFPGRGVTADNRELRWGVTFGNDLRTERWGEYILAHEVLHILGLPDLYLFALQGPERFRVAGGWDIMSFIRTAPHGLAWHKWKLGWLDTDSIECVTSTREVILAPVSGTSGTRAIVVKRDSDTAIVAEVRRRTGADSRLCDSGLLVYTVDASIGSGEGPVRVHSAGTGEDSATIEICGPIYDATYDLRAGKLPRYADAAVAFEIMRIEGDQIVVRVVTESGPRRRPARR